MMNESEYWLKLSEAIRADNELATISKKKRAGTATFEEIQKYQYRSAQIEAEFLSRHLSEPGTGENSERCYELMQRRYQKVNQDLAEFQEKLDQQAGLKIKAQKAKFPVERARQIANSLEDQTVSQEVIQRRAKSAVANIANSFCDDFIQKNAEFKSNTGIKCYITRTTTGKCCAWCTQIAGRYEYGRHPADIFRRHDNCDCIVVYENGKQRQNVWTKKSWSAPDIPDEALNFTPTVFNPEQAKAIERQNIQYKGLTIPGKTDIIETTRYFGDSSDTSEAENPVIDFSAKEKPSLYPSKIAGVERGKPMTFEEADHMQVNPNFRKAKEYGNNCQTCVVAFEARLRGYNVEATPNFRHSINSFVALHTNSPWIDPKTGEHPEYIVDKTANNPKERTNNIWNPLMKLLRNLQMNTDLKM